MKIEQYEFFKKVSVFDSKDQFSGWLWEVLKSQHLPSLSTTSLNGFNEYLMDARQYSHLSVVEVLYDRLSENRRLLLRQSIGDVFQDHSEDTNIPQGVFGDLIYLMGGVRAVESLETLVPTLGNGLLGERYAEDLLYGAIALLMHLAPESPVEKVTLGIVESRYFDEGYLFPVIGILVKCNPNQTAKIFANFAQRVINLRERLRGLDQREQNAYQNSANDLIKRVQRFAPNANLDAIKQTIFE